MANQDQVKLLRVSIDAWNKWRKDNPFEIIDFTQADLKGISLWEANLSGADLTGADLTYNNLNSADLSGAKFPQADLRGAYLSGANFPDVNFREANLEDATLREAKFYEANFSKANLKQVDFYGTDLSGADLSGADLSRADLRFADLIEANLTEANFMSADLHGADLNGAILNNAKFGEAQFGDTFLGNIDFRRALGLEHARHGSSSTIGTNSIVLSKGMIPEVFLRGCGLSDWEIEVTKLYNPNLANQDMDEILYKVHEIRASQPIQIAPLFISYSHDDGEFVDKLEGLLNEKGIRFWRDIHDATSGKLEKQIDRAIRHNPIVLIILSGNSIKSDWVEHEVRLARKLEKETERDVLCPVALDDSWKTSLWPKRVMEQILEYSILDFSQWNDDTNFKNMFVKLIDGLNLYYKKQP